jgi:predicted DNA-binding transcriptional regulator AlpA
MIMSIAEVSQLTKLSESTIRRLVQSDDFPRPVRLHGRKKVWSERAVNSWLHERIGGSAETSSS